MIRLFPWHEFFLFKSQARTANRRRKAAREPERIFNASTSPMMPPDTTPVLLQRYPPCLYCRPSLVLAVLIPLFQQWTGINAIM